PGIAQSFRPEHPRADQRRVDEIPRMEVTVVVTAEFGEEQSRTGLEVCRQRQRVQKRLLEFYRGTSLMSMTVHAARESDVRLPPKIRINRAGEHQLETLHVETVLPRIVSARLKLVDMTFCRRSSREGADGGNINPGPPGEAAGANRRRGGGRRRRFPLGRQEVQPHLQLFDPARKIGARRLSARLRGREIARKRVS